MSKRITAYWITALTLFPLGKVEPGNCPVVGCNNKSAGPRLSRFCFKHRQQIATHRDPALHQYHRLKTSAKERRIRFILTIAQWRLFCESTGYLKDRDKPRADVLSVDRIDSRGPYSFNNIRALTVSENSKKKEEQRRNKVSVSRGRKINMEEYIPEKREEF